MFYALVFTLSCCWSAILWFYIHPLAALLWLLCSSLFILLNLLEEDTNQKLNHTLAIVSYPKNKPTFTSYKPRPHVVIIPPKALHPSPNPSYTSSSQQSYSQTISTRALTASEKGLISLPK